MTYDPIPIIEGHLEDVRSTLTNRIRHLDVEREFLILQLQKITVAGKELNPIARGLADAQRQGRQETTEVHQSGGGGTEVGIRSGFLEDDTGRVQTEDQTDQGKDG